ncbi:hypothetical protein TNCV_3848531 [Trichonephila clavipes]|uniref:Uncharacterized protein n=1 Tax=Trichonephila clavipes TaxID=2585209 RepID=A0A8X6R8B3_TRICX|nr:hypothetical protein TNCV_3848531 [Trichonephila clavipes]
MCSSQVNVWAPYSFGRSSCSKSCHVAHVSPSLHAVPAGWISSTLRNSLPLKTPERSLWTAMEGSRFIGLPNQRTYPAWTSASGVA